MIIVRVYTIMYTLDFGMASGFDSSDYTYCYMYCIQVPINDCVKLSVHMYVLQLIFGFS